jgi:acetylornithine deacetylase
LTESIVELAQQLIAIDSVNPALVAGGAGERECVHVLAEWCGAHGLDVQIVGDEARPSLIARTANKNGRSLLLNGHLDTVGVAGMTEPFEPRVEGGRLYGRGSYDMKGAIAALCVAAAQSDANVIVTAVADEELA